MPSHTAHLPPFVSDVARTLYDQIVSWNYKTQIHSAVHSSPQGTFRSYELVDVSKGDIAGEQALQFAGSTTTFFDIGTSVGHIALRASVLGATVHAFEPSPFTTDRLRKNINANPSANLTLHEVALSDEDDEAQFHVSSDHSQSSLDVVAAEYEGQQVEQTVSVPTRRLDGLDLPDPDVMKVDVEGHELRVLNGARETIVEAKPTVVIEAHRTADGPTDGRIQETMADWGYRTDKIGNAFVCTNE